MLASTVISPCTVREYIARGLEPVHVAREVPKAPAQAPDRRPLPFLRYTSPADSANWEAFSDTLFGSDVHMIVRPLPGRHDSVTAFFRKAGWSISSSSAIESDRRDGFDGVVTARWEGSDSSFDFGVLPALARLSNMIDFAGSDCLSGDRWRFLLEGGSVRIRPGHAWLIGDASGEA